MSTLNARLQIWSDTAANFTSANPTLAVGQQAYETDTGLRKVGDGTTAWNSLDYEEVVITIHNDVTTTSNAAGDITGLSCTLQANSTYIVEGVIHSGCNNTGGVKYAGTIPAAATAWLGFLGPSSNVNTVHWGVNFLDGSLTTTTFNQENNVNRGVFFNGTITTGANAGTFQMQFASATNTQTSTVYKEGTFLRVRKKR